MATDIQQLKDDQLVAAGAYPEPISDELADRVARLALHMTIAKGRRRLLLDGHALRPWEERTPQERAAMRAGAVRVVQALIMLGLVEL